ncbi:helix-turn-helix transcriptional regulator [Streptomyces sp. ISL-100]|uniref:ArsR/SmtB family transcription factor n=1 Tax=Streptomyces sp. ISL-100 TaxID=2819173 RepID=UPI001BEA8513|nr:metalloregulator ArsR/SmtB family transcription factor [Streptomyces sp. ISL-100]MBT2399803.1 helix-turn-helix transcriptional regulator [Streptomyces sp. ISL-100]
MSDTSLERETVEEYARWFQALADPTRILIVRFLSGRPEPVPAGVIVDHLNLNQSTVSHHLKILHNVRFLTRRRAGANILYAVNSRCITQLPCAAEILLGSPARSHPGAGPD